MTTFNKSTKKALSQRADKATFSTTSSTPVMTRCLLSVSIASALLLTACGDDNDNTSVKNSLNAQSIQTFSASQIDSSITPVGSATPNAKCGVAVEKVSYPVKGAAGENTNATAALMLPTGDAADCQGDRPILLYAHGTTTDKQYDFAQVGNDQNAAALEANLIAANFAAQGYIVVAPNYAGYDDSKLDYHPYLVADQQSADMVAALDSARTIIMRQQRANADNYVNIDDSGKLFVSGYSQGGHVAMATARLLEQQNRPVTAIAPSSGPYALAAFGDAIFFGNVNIGATRFAPLLAEGMQKKYGNIYNSPTDIFQPDYASTQLPNLLSFAELVAANQLPEFALFEAKPTDNPVIDSLPDSPLPFAFIGFDDSDYLIKTDYRAQYIADAKANPDGVFPTVMNGAMPAENPQNNMRKALKDNDLRGYIPQMPTLLCGGNQDPTVFYDLNTGAMKGLLIAANLLNPAASDINVTILDVDTTNEAARPNQPVLSFIGQASMNPWDVSTVATSVQTNFLTSRQFVIDRAIQNGVSPTNAVVANYHGGLVSSACTQATREFFDQSFDTTTTMSP